MPLYEYQCEKCGHRFEKIQRMSDPPPDACPVCGGAVHKMQSAPAFQFKGSGWYITDYARKDQGGESKSSGPKSGDDKPASKETGSPEGKDSKESKDSKDSTTKSDKSASSSPVTPASTTPKAS